MKAVKLCLKALCHFFPLIISLVSLFFWLGTDSILTELYFISFFSVAVAFLCAWFHGRTESCLKKSFILYFGWIIALFPLVFFFSYMIHGGAIVWGDYVGTPPTGLMLWLHLLRVSGYLIFLAQIIFVPWILFPVWFARRFRKREQ